MGAFPRLVTPSPARWPLLVLLVAALVAVASAARGWSKGALSDYSLNCVLQGNVIGYLPTQNSLHCELVCKYTVGCTHWSHGGSRGICVARRGYTRRSNAVEAQNFVCGIMY